ncbi:UDP-3-O-acylglucosamine N-acyltransferase [Polystyrenella longa]|uniref:UDP-3-O-acylglucosamine N-acyltransferase n=1 Tax=Polystyrenella longa TaxID=2528007 RepID=A0A518CNN9_9PLAN|nr:hypothetical protein [Polystyrenella longa]QDU80842.1 UDP-3-O-acylglucosamine N-acyltransferase [Polystyrenella longa]
MKPHRLLTLNNVIARIEPVASALELHGESYQTGVAQTSFCDTDHQNSVALATNHGWLKLAVDNDAVSLILTTPRIARLKSNNFPKPLLLCDNLEEVFYYLHNQALHETTFVSPAVERHQEIAPSVNVHPSAVLEGEIVIAENVQVGPFCFLQGPLFIGGRYSSTRFLFHWKRWVVNKKSQRSHQQVKHFGGVRIGANCQIFSGTRIAKSAIFQSDTVLEDEVSCGEEVVIGHDARIQSESIVAAAAAISGKACIGPSCWIGAGSLIADSVQVGHHSSVKEGGGCHSVHGTSLHRLRKYRT